jgi:hypothetical protein
MASVRWGVVGVLCISAVAAGAYYFALRSEPYTCILRPMKTQTRVRSLVQGCVVFAEENDGRFPTQEQWPDALTELGLIEYDLLNSPIDLGDGVSYIYIPGKNTFDETQIVIYENQKHHREGVLVGFADVHVEMIDHDLFDQMLADQLAAQSSP